MNNRFLNRSAVLISAKTTTCPSPCFSYSILVYLLCIAIWAPPSFATAEQSVTLTNNTLMHNLGTHIEYFEDKQQQWTILDILTGKEQPNWLQHPYKNFSPGITSNTFWLKFKVNNSSELNKWLLELGFATLDQIDLYIIEDNQIQKHFDTGQTHPFIDRPILNRFFIFPLDLNKDSEQTFIFRISSDGIIKAPLKIWRPSEFDIWDKHNFLFHGLFYGIIIAMLIYNAFIFLILRDSSYLYYIAYLTTFSCFFLYESGFDYQYLWPSKIGWSTIFGEVAVFFTIAFAAAFTRKILNAEYALPKLDKVIKAVGYFAIAASPSAIFLSHYHTINFTYAITLILIPMVMYLAIHQLRAGFTPAKYFLFAWSTLVLGIFVNLLDMFGIIPSSALTFYSIQLGVLAELLGLSLALASRIDTLKSEKEALQSQREQILEEANQNLNQSNKLKDDFLSAISHELRTPMNGVIGGVDLLRGNDMQAEQREYLNAIDHSSRRLMELINDLLDFTEIQSGRSKRINKTFPIGQIVKSIRDIAIDLRNGDTDFNIRVQNEMPLHLQGDPDLIIRALEQLVENAFKFTHQGNITIEFWHNNEDYPDIQLFIYVKDTGIGIPKDKQALVFQAFHQVETGIRRRYEGMGLGLTLASALAQAMNGRLDLIESNDTGSFFALEVPLLVVESPPVKAPRTANQRFAPITTHFPHEDLESKPLSILIAEDNPTNRLVLSGIIKKLGHKIITASNGKEALRMAQLEKPDLIFMDCQMPEMDGLTATEAIRNLGKEYKDLPIIAVTANVMGDDKQKCFAVGMDDYLKKPVKAQAINDSIEKWG